MAELAKALDGSPKIARAYCDLSAKHFCSAMQIKKTPSVLIVSGRNLHLYEVADGQSFEFNSVRQYLESRAYEADEKPLSTNIESYVRAGERLQMQKKDEK